MMLTRPTTATVVPLFLCIAAVVTVVNGVCNVDDHHPEDGGYYLEGIAGIVAGEIDPNSPNNRRYDNATWATGIDYPDGSVEICTGRFCSADCATNGCPRLINAHTCGMLRFCYPAESGSDVWRLPDAVALANCDFSSAMQVCGTDAGAEAPVGDDGFPCCNVFFEEDARLETAFYASKNGCEKGQRAAVMVDDFDEVGGQCRDMGSTSVSRISKCDCLYDTKPSTLVEPCHSQFSLGCLEGSPADDACCSDDSCVPLVKDIATPEGAAADKARQALCNDEIPGHCTSALLSVDDCCTQTCTQCGIEKSWDAGWSACTSASIEGLNGTCGYAGYEPYACDFSLCQDDDVWHPSNDAFKKWTGQQTLDSLSVDNGSGDIAASYMVGITALVALVLCLLVF